MIIIVKNYGGREYRQKVGQEDLSLGNASVILISIL